MSKQHHYSLTITWTGNNGTGTSAYRDYDRSHTVSKENKAAIACSSDPAFRGDDTKYNPEELLLAALSSCHMLFYLHLCADAGIIVTAYSDHATGIMEETSGGSGQYTSATLYPQVTVTDISMVNKANELHHKAHELCFIANSCNFPVYNQPACLVA
jgi:organic hydroperoxide reductase OsmC/OhrA